MLHQAVLTIGEFEILQRYVMAEPAKLAIVEYRELGFNFEVCIEAHDPDYLEDAAMAIQLQRRELDILRRSMK